MNCYVTLLFTESAGAGTLKEAFAVVAGLRTRVRGQAIGDIPFAICRRNLKEIAGVLGDRISPESAPPWIAPKKKAVLARF